MNVSWKRWALRACAHIRFKPDRGPVEEELLAHLEDRAEALCQSGMGLERAEKQALASMGDADEVGRQLAAVHKPLLGYLWLWSRRALVVCIAVVIWAAFGFSERVFLNDDGIYPEWEERLTEPDSDPHYQWTTLSPDCTDESDGYTFTVSAAALWYNEAYTAEYEGMEPYEVEENTALYLTLVASTWLPKTDSCNSFRSFYAVDDLGNFYPPFAWSGAVDDEIQLRGNYGLTSFWTSEYHAWITSIDPAANWIELRYDRDGRDVCLRIDLTGGESQ